MIQAGNKAIRPTDPTPPSGQVFKYWYKDNSATAFDFNTAITENTTLHAKFGTASYKVSFNTAGGGTIADQYVDYNGLATEPSKPSKTGYDFVSWHTDASCLSEPFDFGTDRITGNVTLYAKFVKQKFTVTIDVDGVKTTQEVEYGGRVTRPSTPSKEGYDFVGWMTTENGTVAFNFNQEITAHTNIYAKFSVESFVVTFNTNGGTPVSPQSVELGKKVNQPSEKEKPEKTGYTFDGWYTDNTFTKEYDFSTPVTKPIVIYAKYSKSMYTVVFYDGNGDVFIESTIAYGEKISEPAEGPVKKHYTFAGWVTASGGTSAFNFNNPITKDTKIYPKYDKEIYKVTFVTVDGENEVIHTTQSVKYGEFAAIPSTNPTKTGYQFIGWGSSATGNTAFTFGTPIEKDTKVYAMYEAERYTVTFDLDGGESDEIDQERRVNYGEYVTRPTASPVKKGHTFANTWVTRIDGEEKTFDFGETKIEGNVVLYAKYNRNPYKVSFESNGGTAVVPQDLLYGDLAEEPVPPTKDAWDFVGWYDNAELQGERYDFSQIVEDNLILYAKWEEKDPYSVHFDIGYDADENNRVVGTAEVVEGTVIADEDIPEDPIRKGYEFDTWVDADGETFDFDKPIRKETTVYASWTPVEYSITYNPNEGTLLIEEPSSYTVIDETFILPVPVRDGYSFKGWRAADKTLYTKIETGKVTGNLELTAKWEEIKAISMNAPEYDFGDAIIVTANTPKAGAKVGLYKVGEVPGDEYEPIIEYDVIDENPVNLFSEAKAWRNPDREEEWYTSSQDVKSLKSGTYQVFLTVGETGEYEQRIVFTILKKQDKMEIVSRTCTTSGYTAISYTDGKVVVTQTEDDKALGHKWIAATCTTVKMCDTCKATEGSELGHTMILKEGIAPTCEEDGTKEHWHCLRCDGRFEDENGEHLMESIVEPLLAHKNTIEKVAYKEPTCGKTMVDGNIEYYRCTECDKKFEDKDGVTILKDDVIIKAKHNPKPLENCWEGQACSDCKELIVSPRAHVPGPEATCTTEQTCIRCDTKLAEKLPHTLSEAATCTKAQICLVCKEVKAEATGHSIKIRKSCTEPYQCEKCEVVFKEGAPEHIKGAPATCSEPQRCLVCNVITDEVEHTFVDANCQSPKHCTVCGLTEGDFGGHTPGLEATCEKDQICSDCGIVLKKAEGHQWSKREYCTDVVACTKCGIPSQTDLAEPDHDLDRNKEHATCTTPVKCKNCPYIYFGGHTPGPLQTCTKDMVCLECDEVLAPANGHSPSAEATCTKDQICTETGCGVILEKRLGHEPGPKATCTSVQKCTREGCGIILNGMKDHKPGVEATCKNPQACTECGVELKEKTGHTPGPEATCTTAKTCSVKGCDYVYEEALGHDMTEVACEVDQHCKRLNCEHTIKAPGHALVTIPEKEATCSEAGWDSYQNCSNCDYTTYTTDTLQPKKNHKTIVIPGTPATCTESGLKDGRMCGLCGAVTREQAEIEPLNHKKTITLEGYEATCTTDGLTEGEKCAYCSLVFKKQEVIPAGHTEAELTGYEPMCEKPGLTDGMMCGVCGKITKAQEVIPATGHTPVTLEGKAATCTANGLSEGQTCGDCGIILKEQETIPATGHKEVTVKGYAATCTTTGLTDGKKCETCGKTTVGQRPISCEGHNWSEGSCLEDSVCSKCSAVEKAPGHMPITIPSEEATCQEEGLTEGLMCGVCDMVLKEQSVLPILPHQVFEAELTPATTKADGVRVKLCECGEVLHTETIYKIKTVKLSFKSAVYNGKVKEPEVVITNSKGKRLTQNDYTVVMAAGRKDVGVYDYKITFKGDYEGTETLKLTVTPAKPKLRAHKPAKNAITVQWKKVEKQATGYQVMVATDKKFEKNVKKTFINKLKTTSYKMTGLKAKTNYYVKVRTYKTVKVDGKDTKIYSPWSAVKTVKTK